MDMKTVAELMRLPNLRVLGANEQINGITKA